ncbi:exosortase A [Litorilituus sediminis]|uniref:Exosortase A n=1 Tax=Litorilituus sediminis TaxID=718192 RepID=A0A4P6P4G1_9GAMM|nr:exosortase A [Litorilituus sediminis]QBG36333.1 exosortase A [Litorilituus sediminis]
MNRQNSIQNTHFIVIASALLLAWFFVYQSAVLGMEAIWSRSDTFAHGYFILPISLWLLWRDKDYLLKAQPEFTWLAVPFLAGSLLVWLIAYAADINVLGQLSAICSLICLIWLLLGNQLAWRYKFPLAYLIFAVPMGENLIPWLQDVTAWFTVAFLKINGIPVFRDGLYIQVPTGMFEVAVACSGIRYLIASIAVGTLYAYLTYSKTYKQVLFILFAIVLPILANGIRAYGIVAIAYYSDMEYATGADHLVYGWVFFGFVIMIMFWLGGFFADKADDENKPESLSAQASKKLNNIIPSTALLALLVSYFVIKAVPVVELPEDHAKASAQYHSTWGIQFVDAIKVSYQAEADDLEVFVAQYANRQTQGELVAWQNVTHDYERWTEVAREALVIANQPVMLVHLRDIAGNPRSYIYQYKIGDFYTVSRSKAKLMQAWNSLTRQSDFSEVRAISLAGSVDLSKVSKKLQARFESLSAAESSLEK